MGLTSFPEATEAPLHSSLVEKRNGLQGALKRLTFFQFTVHGEKSMQNSTGPNLALIRKIHIWGKKIEKFIAGCID